MKKKILICLLCYVLTSGFFIVVFGNMNFFGETGFHMTLDEALYIITTWGLISAIILSAIVFLIMYFVNKK